MKSLPLVLAAMTALSAGAASAQTQTGTFAVRASVNADCTLTTKDMDFGTYSPTGRSRVNATLTVKCTAGEAVDVSLDAGSSGNPQARTMTGQGAALGYQLYKDAGYNQPIDTLDPAFQLTSAANNGAARDFILYGDVPDGQQVASGSYIDTVRVTVSY
jgi:spore coat protein U-like protein